MPRRAGVSILSSDLAITLVVSLVFVWNIVAFMNTSKEISVVDDKISAIRKANAETRNLIENQNKCRETLKYEQVVKFAKSRKMTTPNPGQICVITDEDWQNVPLLTERRQRQSVERITAFHKAKKGNDSL